MKSIKLVDVYTQQAEGMPATKFLYELLAERDPVANISHKEMPTFDQHRRFVESNQYTVWYIVFADDKPVGSVYLTYPPKPSQAGNEIGVQISKSHQGNGYAKQAIYLLMKAHPKNRFLANITPNNAKSITMFEKLGFTLCQYTFELYPEGEKE